MGGSRGVAGRSFIARRGSPGHVGTNGGVGRISYQSKPKNVDRKWTDMYDFGGIRSIELIKSRSWIGSGEKRAREGVSILSPSSTLFYLVAPWSFPLQPSPQNKKTN